MARCLASNPVVALVTVVGARGSTPREAGARMVVTASGDIAGTVGGGRLELEAIETAKALLATGTDTFATRDFALGPSLGQCCGGHVTLGIETITAARRGDIEALAEREAGGGLMTSATVRPGAGLVRVPLDETAAAATAFFAGDGSLVEAFGPRRRRLYLFGAGHVGRALVFALAPLPFDVIWVDERRDMFPAMVPQSVDLVVTDGPATIIADAPPGAFALIMTHDHGVDLDILHAALKSGALGYVGLIGSATKRARFESRLRTLGLGPQASCEFRCPIGVPGIQSKEPAMIAAAVAAELLIEDERIRAADGVPSKPLIAAIS
ncbi:xanthine dehydrogenase accessory protein XdhC [Chthonobacter albigriseus]|uniref:xanthine dehydrogenase accessory protein XdhC n=1 Tax=Chthonobacter albigriseus TaxID=1683161 RepID=UPI001FCE459A|nr:xanthine dehydrogenase accessory protein XdhC [Chthonobacter albigriseus]